VKKLLCAVLLAQSCASVNAQTKEAIQSRYVEYLGLIIQAYTAFMIPVQQIVEKFCGG
jgi:hypothetical protein